MKHTLIPLLLSLVLLCGCAAQQPSAPVTTVPATTEDILATDPSQFMETGKSGGDLTRYSLSQRVSGFLPMNRGLLFFSGSDATTLTLADPDSREILAEYTAGLVLTPRNFTVQKLQQGLSFFDGARRETVVLDDSLAEQARIPAPEGLSGAPLLSPAGDLLYYCTSDALRVQDLTTGISRVLRQTVNPVQGLSGLLLEGSVLQLSITDAAGNWETLFLDSQTGRLLTSFAGNLTPESGIDRYFVSTPDGYLFGGKQGDPLIFRPRMPEADCFFLPDPFQVMTAAAENGATVLELYDLSSGLRTAVSALPGLSVPESVCAGPDGSILFLLEGDLVCWQPEKAACNDPALYAAPRFTRQDPDYDGLAVCSLYAQQLGQRYGIDVRIYQDAVAVQPWDYQLEYEYQSAVLMDALKALDTRLAVFPEGFLQTMAQSFDGLHICLVREIAGAAPVSGVQFFQEYDAYVALRCADSSRETVYHELSHLMETVVLTRSTAYDRWENLNPQGFAYGRSPDREWLQPGREWFVDDYAMSSPQEDRARLFEAAMAPDRGDLFRSPPLQEKLRQLCLGIRAGFDLENYEGTLPWEQYLP